MEYVEDVVIVGAGIAGLATALGLHRIGLRSLVLESSDRLRVNGYAITTWTNAWKALDALGMSIGGDNELSRVGSGRALKDGFCLFSHWSHHSPVVIYGTGEMVLVGCDGVNSVVAKWLGLQKPAFTGRSAIRGLAEFPDGHGYKPELLQYSGKGFRSGFLPCNDKTIYWFLTYSQFTQYKDMEDDPAKMKQFVLSKLQKAPNEVINALEKTELGAFISTPLRFRVPWNLLWGDICNGGVCVAGDALHPMTPDLGQGGCSALEDGVTLARCLGEALLGKHKEGEEECGMIKRGLEKYAKERRWRGFRLIATAYVLGFIQQSDGVVMNFLRDKCFSRLMAGMYLKRADFDCGKLYSP
ncbi:hypothetical protein MRB53_001055 [Persea americana]|uniref:Uncharacterized protein n=1 Tax=Persea americana TaxID=3435 RepID=A0ACC2MSY4_PERAE|nr:hypothetical protein MRB53_001055 [Persea americana]